MSKKALHAGLVLLGGLLLVSAVVYWFRLDLLRFGADTYLTDYRMSVSKLQGVRLGRTHASVGELELVLHASGQVLALSDIELTFSFPESATSPVIDTLAVASVRLLRGPSVPAEVTAPSSAGLLLSEFLQLLRDFPLASVVIDDLAVPQSARPLALTLASGAGTFSLRLHSGTLELLASYTQADAAEIAQLRMTLNSAAVAAADLTLRLQPVGDAYRMNGSGRVDIADVQALAGELLPEPAALPVNAAHLEWDLTATLADDFLAAEPASFDLGMQPGSALVLAATLVPGLGELEVAFDDRAELRVTTGENAEINAGTLPLSVVGDWQGQALNVDALLTLAQCRFSGNRTCSIDFDGSASLAAYKLTGGLRVVASGIAAGAGEFTVQSEGLELGGLRTWLPPFDIAARLSLDQDALSFDTPLLLRNAPADAGLRAEGAYDLASGAGSMRVTVPPLVFAEEGRPLSAFLSGWPYPFDLLSGALAAELELQWQAGVAANVAGNGAAGANAGTLTGSLTGELSDAAGYYDEIFFRGLNTAFDASLESAATMTVSTPLLSLAVADLDVGVPISDIAVAYRFERGRLLIASFYGEVLGGTVSAEDVSYDFGSERNLLTLRFDGLQLERMLALVEYDGVEAFGAVSGELPLAITANGVEVAAGTLHADRPGGSIRYLGGPEPGDNASLNLMNQALSNYRFESLESSIDYAPDGELLLSMQLQGHNPDLDNGRRINLNLNLSDNIPALLKSLQTGRAIEDFLEQQYQ